LTLCRLAGCRDHQESAPKNRSGLASRYCHRVSATEPSLSGLELSRRFYEGVLRSAIQPTPHAAARVGSGSEVLGFDTPRSTDHGWGPRCQVFVSAEDVDTVREKIESALPESFLGWPVRFGWDDVPVQHHVEVGTIERWLISELAVDPRGGLADRDWLMMPQQQLLHVTAGEVFHDDTGELTDVRGSLAWYPHEVWLYLLGCAWRRIAQEEAFVGRTAEVGDDLGSRIVTARLARDLIRLCFLVERRYAPYAKWLGTAFTRLDAAAEVQPALERALRAESHENRQAALVEAYEAIARRFNALGVTTLEEAIVRPHYSRPFLVLMSERFADASFDAIDDDSLRSLPPVGSVDQYLDSTDALYPERARRTSGLVTPPPLGGRERPGW
jgi:hypothetical protein